VQSIHTIPICTTAIGTDCEAAGRNAEVAHPRGHARRYRDHAGKGPAQAQLALLQFNWPILTGCGNTRPAKGRRETCFRSSYARYRDYRGVSGSDRERDRTPDRTALAERQLAGRDRGGNVAVAAGVATGRRVDIGLHHSYYDHQSIQAWLTIKHRR